MAHPWWAGISGVLTAVAVVLAVLPLLPGDSTGQGPTRPGVAVTGSCNAVGSQSSVTCVQQRADPSGPPAPAISVQRISVPCGSYYVMAGPRASIPPPPDRSEPDWEARWARFGPQYGAADANSTNVLVNVSSRDDRQVTITGLRFVVVDRKPAPRGFLLSTECGGPGEARYVQADLDADPPVIVASSREPVMLGGNEWRRTPLTFPYTVTDQDTAQLLLVGSTKRCECRWKAELAWQAGDQKGVKSIDLDGAPFHTATSAGSTPLTADGGVWR